MGPEHLLSRRTFSMEEEMLELKHRCGARMTSGSPVSPLAHRKAECGSWEMKLIYHRGVGHDESKTELEGSNL